MSTISAVCLPDYLREEILLHPENRKFKAFDLVRLLGTVFEPTQGCKVCILIDFDEPAELIKNYNFLSHSGFPVQKNAHKHFYQTLAEGALDDLGKMRAMFVAVQDLANDETKAAPLKEWRRRSGICAR